MLTEGLAQNYAVEEIMCSNFIGMAYFPDEILKILSNRYYLVKRISSTALVLCHANTILPLLTDLQF